MTQMDKDVERRIRALPGNNMCQDCNQPNPQWASVSYGSMMCLECSGHHRSIGVHLSFVRSVAMDSWTDKQIAAMEKSGGNQKLVDFFSARGIDKSMPIPKKYNTKQAAYYRERLARLLEGKTEPPPDPGRYDPVTGGSEAQGAEPLPGETTDQYNARQARLRDEARERLRQKFGGSGMGGMGSMGSMGGCGSPAPEESSGLGGLIGGAAGLLKSTVLENERLRAAVGGVGGLIGDTIQNARVAVATGSVIDDLKSNVKLEGDSLVGRSLGLVGSLIGREGNSQGSLSTQRSGSLNGLAQAEDDEAFFAAIGAKKRSGHIGVSDSSPNNSNASSALPARNKSGVGWADDEWGGNGTSNGKDDSSISKQLSNTRLNSGSDLGAAKPAAVAPAPLPVKEPERYVAPIPAVPTPKKAVKLQEADDFFAEFGV